jgi:hypothetical protein
MQTQGRPGLVTALIAIAVVAVWFLASLNTDEPESSPLGSATETPVPSSTASSTTPIGTPRPSPSPTTPPATSKPPNVPATGQREQKAIARLEQLKIKDRVRPPSTYSRDAFGSGWIDTDHNGCNQRDDVLLRDAVAGTVRTGWQGRCDHDVLAGTWIDPYTGRKIVLTDMKEMRQSMAIQIDHIVPLSEAWVSGASEWSDDRRHGFANDLDELLAVDGPTNESKGDGDPAAWRPRKGYQCTYAERWIGVKLRWDLVADPSEVLALRQMLSYCK